MPPRDGPAPRDQLPAEIDRAHLVDPAEAGWYRIARYAAPDDLRELARSYWVPVWSLPPGASAQQRVLQYPVCLLVVSDSYARWYGVSAGLSRTTLAGAGWAVGLMLQPATGYLVTRAPLTELTDRHLDLRSLDRIDGADLVSAVRAAMTPDPADPTRQAEAMTLVETALRRLGDADAEGVLVNEIVELVETTPDLRRVDDLCDRVAMSERGLQRLLRRRVGISPRWLIRRRRLHEGSAHLQSGETDLAGLAHDLGYADQAHFTKDFRSATGLTPGRFGTRFRE